MANILKITVDSPDEYLNSGAYGAGALLHIQSSATEAGAYADLSGTGATTTVTITTGVEVYSAFDPGGTLSTWYKTRYENVAGTRVSDWTPAFQAGGITTAYASLEMFRDYIRNQSPVASDADAQHELLALEAAARAIDRECGRTFALASATPTARVYTAGISTGVGWPYRRYAVDTDDFFGTATVAFDATGNGSYTTPVTTFRAQPANAAAKGKPYTSLLFDTGTYPSFGQDGVQVTAAWGWNAYPAGVVNANLIQAARFLKRREAPFGVAGSPELGNELRLLAKLDPDVAVLLSDVKLDWGTR